MGYRWCNARLLLVRVFDNIMGTMEYLDITVSTGVDRKCPSKTWSIQGFLFDIDAIDTAIITHFQRIFNSYYVYILWITICDLKFTVMWRYMRRVFHENGIPGNYLSLPRMVHTLEWQAPNRMKEDEKNHHQMVVCNHRIRSWKRKEAKESSNESGSTQCGLYVWMLPQSTVFTGVLNGNQPISFNHVLLLFPFLLFWLWSPSFLWKLFSFINRNFLS